MFDKAEKYKFVRSSCNDIYWNFALEEYMLDTVKDNEFIFYVWRNSPSVLIGRHQNIYSECNLDIMKKEGVKIVRRRSGGGTVYFDLGNVTYSFIAPKKIFNIDDNFNFVIKALDKVGFNTYRSGRNDIIYNDFKISGNAFYNTSNRYLHHGTILLNVDIENMAKYLNVSKKKLESKGVKSVKSRVANLSSFNKDLYYDDIVKAFYETYTEIAGNNITITEIESFQSNPDFKKYYDKHISSDWIYGKNPAFNQSIKERFDWGEVDIYLQVKENKIINAHIYTDSLFPDLFDKINELLSESDYNKNSITNIIDEKLKFSIFEYISIDEEKFNIIKKDIISLIKKL